MNAKKCDRCNKFYELYNVKESDCDPNSISLYQIKNDSVCRLVNAYELCPKCMTELQEWTQKIHKRKIKDEKQ